MKFRSQSGSNNAYSLNPELEWNSPENFDGGWALDWQSIEDNSDLLETVTALSRIRTSYITEVTDEFFTGALDQGTKRKDLAWFNKDGLEMTSHTWQDNSSRHLAFLIDTSHKQGLFAILNSASEELEIVLPNQLGEIALELYLILQRR